MRKTQDTKSISGVVMEANLDGFRFLSHSAKNMEVWETNPTLLPNPSPGEL